MNMTEHLTDKERMARIGQLLAKGITLMLMHEAEEKRQAKEQAALAQEPPVAADTLAGLDDDHRRILEFLLRVGKSSPREIQDSLEMSKATLFRRLRELQTAGLVERTGKSAAVRYRASAQAIRSAKQKHATAASALPGTQPVDQTNRNNTVIS